MDEHGEDAVATAMQRMLYKEERTLKQQGNTDRDLDDMLDYLCGPLPEWEGASSINRAFRQQYNIAILLVVRNVVRNCFGMMNHNE